MVRSTIGPTSRPCFGPFIQRSLLGMPIFVHDLLLTIFTRLGSQTFPMFLSILPLVSRHNVLGSFWTHFFLVAVRCFLMRLLKIAFWTPALDPDIVLGIVFWRHSTFSRPHVRRASWLLVITVVSRSDYLWVAGIVPGFFGTVPSLLGVRRSSVPLPVSSSSSSLGS